VRTADDSMDLWDFTGMSVGLEVQNERPPRFLDLEGRGGPAAVGHVRRATVPNIEGAHYIIGEST
jgi:hypothetical protein